MRTLVLILVFGAAGLSPFFLGGTVEARRDLGVPPDRCIEVVQDQIEELLASGPIAHLPPGILKLGLECIPKEGWWATPLVPGTDVPGIEAVPLTHVEDGQQPPTGGD